MARLGYAEIMAPDSASDPAQPSKRPPLVSYRKRAIAACEECGSAFETYATGNIRRFCSDAHRMRAYARAHPELVRQQQREWYRRRVPRPTEIACRRCGVAVPVPPRGKLPRYCGRVCTELAYVDRLDGETRERRLERRRQAAARRRAAAKAAP
jgi:hypothetical protein